ncbi:MAG: hypothetical protein WBN66_06315 [Smithella sp.]
MSEIRSRVNTKEFRDRYDGIFRKTNGKLKYKVELWDDMHGFLIHSWHSHLENAQINAQVISESRKKQARVVRAGKIIQEFEGK